MRDQDAPAVVQQRTLTSDERKLFLAEYRELRAEIVKRIDIQHQLISIAVIAPGTLLTVGIQSRSGLLILLYPIFAMFLAAAWSHNGRRAWTIGHYLDRQIREFGAADIMRWEGYFHDLSSKRRMGRLNFFASQGIFVGTQILAILVGLSLAHVDMVFDAFTGARPLTAVSVQLGVALVIAIVCTLVTLILLRPISNAALPRDKRGPGASRGM